MRLAWPVALASLAVGCAAGAQPTAPAPPVDTNPLIYLAQALVALALVVGLIYGLFYLLRRTVGAAGAARQCGPAEVVQSLPLSAGNILHVVRLQGRLYLVPSGPQGAGPVLPAGFEAPAAPEVDDVER